MISLHLKGRGISNPRVLDTFQKVKREQFLPTELEAQAYGDHPLSIGRDQTISQPYIVAVMTELLELAPQDRVLEIGTGSGYQTAILAELVKEVYSIESINSLHEMARERLKRLNYQNVHLKYGQGEKGWPEEAPFDKIIVTAAAREIPQPLIDQLKEGGRMVIPVGDVDQDLILGRKEHGILVTKPVLAVRFVPIQNQIS